MKQLIGRRVEGILLLALLSSVVGCGQGGSETRPSTSAARPAATVSVYYLPILTDAVIFVGEDQGLFKKWGITNNLQLGQNPFALLAPQSQGQADVVRVGNGPAYFNAINQGLRIRVGASAGQYVCSSDTWFMVRQGLASGVTSVRDLRGKTIAISARGSASQYWLDLALQKAGMTEADVRVVPLDTPSTTNAIKTGAIDAGFVSMPLALQLAQAGTAKMLTAPDQIVPGDDGVFFSFSQQFISQEHGRVAADWLAAYIQATRFYLDPANRETVIDTLAKWTKIDRALLETMYGTEAWPWKDPNAEVNTKQVDSQDLPWALKNQLIQATPKTSDYYEQGPLKDALNMVGRVPVKRACSGIPLPKLT